MTAKKTLIVALLLATIATPAPAAAPLTYRAEAFRFDPQAVPAPDRVLAVLNHTAAAQIAALAAQPLHIPRERSGGVTVNWISATFLIGLGRLARVSDEAGAQAYLREVAEHYNFGLLGAWSPHNMMDADNVAIGEVYEELAARSGEAGEIAPLRDRLDGQLALLETPPPPGKLVWWWCDSLFMAPPVFARLSVQTGDDRYLKAMDAQWWHVYDRLWSPEHKLFWRDERFPLRKTRGGQPLFWSRGNGWVAAGLARLLDTLPADHPSRARYIATFRTLMDRVSQLQRKEDGLWTANLLDPTDPSGPETTGAALFAYAMAWGVNHGVLDRKAYLPRVERAWSGLAAKVQPNGLLGFAQRAGDQPVPSAADDHALYGTGAFLLAGVEVMDLGKGFTAFPSAEPRRDPPGPVRLPIALRPKPAGATPEQIADWARSQEERQAMIDLSFDPPLKK
ncbi:glycoside hydrolase family 88 protein [Sphingomonas sp. BIUV-7]|uniref:Glycoside hydrolase family 88 protein n=1 Tax=Sphingomonas natans TaxID=3063330 RepID=A0ABT8Y4A4_9SPHN|nr:glycoside hydrolase family 88 protein [Sphingomonas sp. BIUV-7]MDO6412827.1 glycoside hydrolase family 88 protein [Sphingomonas sp. BIUV-7]